MEIDTRGKYAEYFPPNGSHASSGKNPGVKVLFSTNWETSCDWLTAVERKWQFN